MTDLMKTATRCSARRKSGQPCRNYAIRGANVCRMHGGAAPQVKAAAQVRILMAADRAAAELVNLMYDKAAPPAVRLAAARDLLDRAGLNARAGVDVEIAVHGGSLLERNLAEVIVDYGDEDDNVIDAELVEPEPEPTSDRRALRPKRRRTHRSPDTEQR